MTTGLLQRGDTAMTTPRRMVRLLAAFVVPCVMFSVAVVLDEEKAVPHVVEQLSLWASLALGYILAVPAAPNSKLLLAILYFPAALVATNFSAMTIVLAIYGGP